MNELYSVFNCCVKSTIETICRRWKCECVFSDIKRMLGETLRAHSTEGIVRALMLKTSVFNQYKAVRSGNMEEKPTSA